MTKNRYLINQLKEARDDSQEIECQGMKRVKIGPTGTFCKGSIEPWGYIYTTECFLTR